jgi:hypothetical protein
MKDKKMYRQGDCLLVLIDSIPKDAVKAKNNIIAYGESSDHCHAMTGEVEVLEHEGKSYMVVGPGGKLEHVKVSSPGTWTGEHHPIELPEGKYEVIHQREYDPWEKHSRAARD